MFCGVIISISENGLFMFELYDFGKSELKVFHFQSVFFEYFQMFIKLLCASVHFCSRNIFGLNLLHYLTFQTWVSIIL